MTDQATNNPYSAGLVNVDRALDKAATQALKPAPKLSLSEWANTHAYLSPETSANPGKFRSFGYQDGIMDAVTDPSVKQITVMKSARIGFTKILDHVVGYYIAQDPAPILIVQPRVEDAEDYSRTEIAHAARHTGAAAPDIGAALFFWVKNLVSE